MPIWYWYSMWFDNKRLKRIGSYFPVPVLHIWDGWKWNADNIVYFCLKFCFKFVSTSGIICFIAIYSANGWIMGNTTRRKATVRWNTWYRLQIWMLWGSSIFLEILNLFWVLSFKKEVYSGKTTRILPFVGWIYGSNWPKFERSISNF